LTLESPRVSFLRIMDNVNLQTGDLVVGTNDPTKSVFSPDGRRLLQEGVVLVGSEEDITRIQDKIKTAGEKTGKPLVENKKYKKKINKTLTNYTSTPATQRPAAEVPAKVLNSYIYFENSFGRIRCGVEHVQEHAQAFMLVFGSEDDIVFEPKIGETLELTYERIKYSVYYPGVIFDWTDGIKKVMILFKSSNENE